MEIFYQKWNFSSAVVVAADDYFSLEWTKKCWGDGSSGYSWPRKSDFYFFDQNSNAVLAK
jgi:hypothetical protein